MKRVLVAATPEAAQRVAKALTPYFKLTLCTSLPEARSSLNNKKPDVVMCSLCFDGGRVIDFLRYVKTRTETSPMQAKSIPLLCIRAIGDTLPPVIHQSIEKASIAVGAKKYIDFREWQDEFGDEVADDKLRSVVRRQMRLAALKGMAMSNTISAGNSPHSQNRKGCFPAAFSLENPVEPQHRE
jgi:hypothetical protein